MIPTGGSSSNWQAGLDWWHFTNSQVKETNEFLVERFFPWRTMDTRHFIFISPATWIGEIQESCCRSRGWIIPIGRSCHVFFLLFGVRYGIWWSNFHSLFQQNMEGSSRNRGLTCLNHTCPPQNQIPTHTSGLLLFANNIQGKIIWFYIHMLCWFIFSSSSKFKGRLKRKTNKSQSHFITSRSLEFVMLSSPTPMLSAGFVCVMSRLTGQIVLWTMNLDDSGFLYGLAK